VAEVEVVGIIEDSKDIVWELTQEDAGIKRDFYDDYYEGKEKAIAYQLGEVIEFDEPKPLADFGLRCAPQSFAYLSAAN
jgi:predicted transcriptional regulator